LPLLRRHSKFGGTYRLHNVKSISDKDMIYHKPLNAFTSIDFDQNKVKIIEILQFLQFIKIF
jgi:hypothetical protein